MDYGKNPRKYFELFFFKQLWKALQNLALLEDHGKKFQVEIHKEFSEVIWEDFLTKP